MYITLVVISFGWVAHRAAVLGEHKLMPVPDTNIIVANCDNGYPHGDKVLVRA